MVLSLWSKTLTKAKRMKCVIDGRMVSDFDSFIAELEGSVRSQETGSVDFGFDLNSLIDSLHGGYGGTPPFDIVVRHADSLSSLLGYNGVVQYCDKMIHIIDSGGRGLVQVDSRAWFESAKSDAVQKNGKPFVEWIIDAIRCAPASIEFVLSDGRVLAKS